MATWEKVVVMALAAMVAVLPAFSQISMAHGVSPQTVQSVLPVGEELTDTALAEAEGEQAQIVLGILGGLAAVFSYLVGTDEPVWWKALLCFTMGFMLGWAGGVAGGGGGGSFHCLF